MNERIEKAFNEQIKNELESAYIYLAMSAYFESQGWKGMAKWMRTQVKEEQAHAMKFYDHIFERNGRVHFTALAQPKTEWASPVEAWKEAYKHEQFITGTIKNLAKLAEGEGDYSARPLLDWFLNEQIEEEDQTRTVVDALEKIGTSMPGLFMLDAQLGKRE